MTQTSLAIDGDTITIFTHNDFNKKKVIASGTFEQVEPEIRKRSFKHVFVDFNDHPGRLTARKVNKFIEENQNVENSR